MTTTPRIQWLTCVVWGVLFVGLCAIASAIGWLIERFIAAYGPWVLAHADWIFAGAAVASVVAVLWIKIGEDTQL